MKIIKFCIVILGMLFLVGCSNRKEISLEPVEAVIQEQETPDLETGDKGMSEADRAEEETEERESDCICVYICGAVKVPGVYELRVGSRVYDGILAAGGLIEEAAKEAVNQARKLQDEEQIYIPTREEMSFSEEWNKQEFATEKEPNSGLVNINTADEATLCTLPGVGATRAEAIINYRKEHGDFSSIEEIMNVEGIKDGLFSKLEALITVH